MLNYNQRIAIAVLVCVGAALVWGDRLLWERSHQHDQQQSNTFRANSDAKQITESEKADDRIARYTLWLAILTGALSISTVMLWWQTRRSAQIAEKALTGLERPRILHNDCSFGFVNDAKRAQVGIINLGRDPGRITKITAKFFDNDLPAVPDFNLAETQKPESWILPAATYDQPRQGRAGFLFEGGRKARFFAVRVFYEWDFGKYEYAFACTAAVAPAAIPEIAGGPAYNYEKKHT